MRIAYFYNEEWEKDYLVKHFPDDIFNFIKGNTSENASLHDPDVTVLSVFVNSPVTADVLDRFPNVKIIATRSTGYDHIDFIETAKRGIIVANVPTYGEHTVAEFSMALLLALSRRIVDAYKRIETTGSFSQDGLRGFDLRGRTIGIIGTGHIGEHMIRMAKAFGMKVLAFDVFPKPDLATELDYQYVSLNELLASADVVSLHAPYNEHTHHMINMENITMFKRGSYLINTSRGGLVETVALVKGLEEGILAGAGLDVLEEEGQMVDENMLLATAHPNEQRLRIVLANHYLINHPQVIVTAHIAFNTQEAIERILNVTIDNIQAFKNEAPIHIVNPQ